MYKDYYIAPGLLSGLKSNNKAIQVIGSVYAEENGLDNCLVLNTNKSVIEALNGNLFLVKGDRIKTPPLSDGCLKGDMRQQVLDVLRQEVNLIVEEASISPFELQKADELFVTNVIVCHILLNKFIKYALNIHIRISQDTHDKRDPHTAFAISHAGSHKRIPKGLIFFILGERIRGPGFWK